MPGRDRPSAATMRHLWGRMAVIYGGSRWASTYSALPEHPETGEPTLAADTWARALAGISTEQIAIGLRACLLGGDTYVPSPQLFRARCLGIPDLAEVRWMHRNRGAIEVTPFYRLVWSYLDPHALRIAPRREADAMIEDAYDLARMHVLAGKAYPAEPVALVERQSEPRTPASEGTARAHLDAMAAAVGAIIEAGDR